MGLEKLLVIAKDLRNSVNRNLLSGRKEQHVLDCAIPAVFYDMETGDLLHGFKNFDRCDLLGHDTFTWTGAAGYQYGELINPKAAYDNLLLMGRPVGTWTVSPNSSMSLGLMFTHAIEDVEDLADNWYEDGDRAQGDYFVNLMRHGNYNSYQFLRLRRYVGGQHFQHHHPLPLPFRLKLYAPGAPNGTYQIWSYGIDHGGV